MEPIRETAPAFGPGGPGGPGSPARPVASASAPPDWFPLAWWMRLTAPPEPHMGASFATRDVSRRARLLSLLIVGALAVEAGAFWQYFVVDPDHPRMGAVVCVALGVLVLIAVLNRFGHVLAAGILLTLLAEIPLLGVWATGGQVDLLYLGSYYLLVGSELVAASVLFPASVFVVASLNSLLIWASITFSPHTPAFALVLASNDAQQAYAGPIAMQFIVAIVAFLWARSTLGALRRADRAEEIAELERREVEQQRQLEADAHSLLDVHVRLANGDFSARVPSLRSQLLWQVGNSLNNLVGRLARYAHAEFTLRREQEEVRRLAEALYVARSGHQPVWPAPSGVPLDPVTEAIRSGSSLPSGPRTSFGYDQRANGR